MIEVEYGTDRLYAYPKVEVKLSSIDTGRFASGLTAKLDTGADRTVIPSSILDTLGIPPSDEAEFEVADGGTVILPLFLVNLSVEGLQPLDLIAAASANEDLILLGRDVLNLYCITLDGPNGRLQLSGT